MKLTKDAPIDGSQWDSYTVTDLRPEDFPAPSPEVMQFIETSIAAGVLKVESPEAMVRQMADYWITKTPGE